MRTRSLLGTAGIAWLVACGGSESEPPSPPAEAGPPETPAGTLRGELDTTFGEAGIVPLTDSVFTTGAMAVDAEGRILVASHTPEDQGGKVVVTRFLANGARDATFGVGGIARTELPANIYVGASPSMAVQPDGHVVVVAMTETRSPRIARLQLDGSLDASVHAPTTDRLEAAMGDEMTHVVAITVQADGKVVGVGSTAHGRLVVRFMPDGNLDESFADRGAHVTPRASRTSSFGGVAIRGDGRICAVGSADDVWVKESPETFDWTPVIVECFLANGQRDAAFGDGTGMAQANGTSFGSSSLVIRADGTIVTVASKGNNAIVQDFDPAGHVREAAGVVDPRELPNDVSRSGGAIIEGADGALYVVGGESDRFDPHGPCELRVWRLRSTSPTVRDGTFDFAKALGTCTRPSRTSRAHDGRLIVLTMTSQGESWYQAPHLVKIR